MDLAILDEKNKDEKWKRVEEEENFVTSKKRFHAIEKLSERYHIALPDHKAKNLTEKQMLNQFVEEDRTAYYTYKNQSDLKRTMIKCHFKKKRKPERDKRVDDFKRKFELDQVNELTLQRLSDQLDHLRKVNIHWYNIEIDKFKEV